MLVIVVIQQVMQERKSINKLKHLILFGILFFVSFCLKAQTTFEMNEGTISFISSQNTYIRYKSTSGLSTGDTLYSYQNNQLIPAFVIKNLSSTSVVCSSTSTYKFNVNDKIISKNRIITKTSQQIISPKNDTIVSITDDTIINLQKELHKINKPRQIITGNFGVAAYSTFSNTIASNSYVANYNLTLNIANISQSRFSLESNIMFRQENGKWEDVKKDVFNGLKIYSLSLKYDLTNTSFMSFGRKINPNISNIGAIDGLNYEKSFKNIYFGGFVGSRPSYNDYSFDVNLMQYGFYVGHNIQTNKSFMQNSLAIVEQTNHSQTDRRFAYFQHSNSLLKNVYMFYSLELDLYKVVNNQKQNTLSFTSTYFSLRYRPIKKLSLSGTYDSRKNVIYYETDKNYLSSLIDQETRQGFSLYANFSISNSLYIGAKVGYRFQNSDIRPSKNVNMFVSKSDLLKSHISTTLSVTMLESNYLNCNIYNIRIYRGFKSDKINVGLGYSYVNNKITHIELPLVQHIANADISAEIIKKLLFSINFETNYEKPNKFYRLYLILRKRF